LAFGGIQESLDIVRFPSFAVGSFVFANGDLAPATSPYNSVPVRLQFFTVLTLADGGEKLAKHPLTTAVQEQVMLQILVCSQAAS
jgi:hypothetical protein